MKLTARLLSFLNRVFDKDPHDFLALRLRYDGGTMRWQVADATLSTWVNGGQGKNLTVDLKQYTLRQLASFLAAQPGYTVVYLDGSDAAGLGARTLLDDSGDQGASNGDHLRAYTNVLWAYLEAVASELAAARAQLTEMLKQLSTKTASDVWLDELGGYYGIPRQQGEADAAYGPRIIAEVLRPRTNNIAIANAIKVFTGQDTTVTDVVTYPSTSPLYNAAATYNGAQVHNSTAQPRYGLFDVQYGYDLENGGSIADFQASVAALIGRLRAGGTQLRSLLLAGSKLYDTYDTPPTDNSPMPLVVGTPGLVDALTAPVDSAMAMTGVYGLSDALNAPIESATLTVTPNFFYNGTRTHNGDVPYAGTSNYSVAI